MTDNNKNNFIHALTIIESGSKTLGDRGQLRDQPQGERSMAAVVRVWNALTGHNITEAEGWEFMIALKLVRGRQGKFHEDDYTDLVGYSALLGECESKRDRGSG